MRGGSHLSTTHGGTSLTWLAPMHARSSSLLLLPTALRRLHLHIGNTSSWFVLINQTWWIKRTRTPKANVGEPKIQGTRPRADDDAKWSPYLRDERHPSCARRAPPVRASPLLWCGAADALRSVCIQYTSKEPRAESALEIGAASDTSGPAPPRVGCGIANRLLRPITSPSKA
jgi:hypothetical protein